jgi:hypothetical protein
VKQTRSESLQECLARAVLVSSRTPTLNSELGQHAHRSLERFAGGPRVPAKLQPRGRSPSEQTPCPFL